MVATTTATQTNSKDIDFIHNFINLGRFPVYKFESLKEVINNQVWTVKKIPMFVDGVVTWTRFHIDLNPSWRTDPFPTDVDIKLEMITGKAWLLIEHKDRNGGDILEAGHMALIPAGSTFQVLNQSKTEKCTYTLDANTLLEIE